MVTVVLPMLKLSRRGLLAPVQQLPEQRPVQPAATLMFVALIWGFTPGYQVKKQKFGGAVWLCNQYLIKQTEEDGWLKGVNLTLVFVGPIMTFNNTTQVGMVALNQCSEGIFGYIHALGDSLSQVALLKKTYQWNIALHKPDAM